MTSLHVQAGRLTAAAARRAAQSDGVPVTWAVVSLMSLIVLAIGTISPELLTAFKIHYISNGGHFFEKLHPATYLIFVTFVLMLLCGAGPIAEFDRIFSNAKGVLIYLFTCGLLLFQCLALKRPITGVIDTFLLPVLFSLIVWNLTLAQRKPLVLAVHFVIWVNILLGFYEYFSKHRFVPMTLGNQIVLGDWRSTALLGHPASAAAAIAIYVMALLLKPKAEQMPLWSLPAMLIASSSLMVFGGRTALVAVVVVFAGVALWNCVRVMRGDRFGLASVIVTVCGLMLLCTGLSVVFDSGIFDKMLFRFAHDSNSAHARIASLHLLSYFDWKELLLGTQQSRSGALQAMQGLEYGIENFWIACIVQYGLIQTVLITIGLAAFFIELLKRTSPGACVAVLFICVVAASSVSFSSKNIALTMDVAIILLLLPRQRNAQLASGWRGHRDGDIAYLPAISAR